MDKEFEILLANVIDVDIDVAFEDVAAPEQCDLFEDDI